MRHHLLHTIGEDWQLWLLSLGIILITDNTMLALATAALGLNVGTAILNEPRIGACASSYDAHQPQRRPALHAHST